MLVKKTGIFGRPHLNSLPLFVNASSGKVSLTACCRDPLHHAGANDDFTSYLKDARAGRSQLSNAAFDSGTDGTPPEGNTRRRGSASGSLQFQGSTRAPLKCCSNGPTMPSMKPRP